MKTIIATIIATGLLAASGAAAQQGEGPVLVTLSGAVGPGGTVRARDDAPSLFAANGITFENGHGLDRAALAALPSRDMSARLAVGAPTVTVSGPSLASVLAAVGAEVGDVDATALDGYVVTVPADLIAAHDPILALSLDDTPLAVGGLGPAMVAFPAEVGDADPKTIHSLQIWAVFHLNAIAAP